MEQTPTNPRGSTSPSSTSGPSGPLDPSGSLGTHRKERGAIAAQACQTCRNRKTRCDEQRPKCGTCQRFKLECHYREPQPTKKDKTLMEILGRIRSLEGKIDNIALRGGNVGPVPATFGGTLHPNTLAANPSIIMGTEAITSLPLSALGHHENSIIVPPGAVYYRYVSGVHLMLGWPVVQQLLEPLGSKLLGMEHGAPAAILDLHDAENRLPSRPSGPMARTEYAPARALSLPTPTSAGSAPLGASNRLTWDSMQRLSNSFFDTFNHVYPIMDRQIFVSGIMTSVFNDGFDDEISSTLAFLVFALGEVAIAAVEGAPVAAHSGRPSGVKGGSPEQPPGLALFNEARRRMGFTLTECSLENVQIFALAGLYCGTCSRHMEFWRMSTTASLACHALIVSKPSELDSPRADLIRRSFWFCLIIETYFHLELGLPLTGLDKLENMVGLPDFSGPYSHEDYLANQASHFQEHFASQIVLRRLTMEFHNVLTHADSKQKAPETVGLSFLPIGAVESSPTPSLPAVMKQLALQLDEWRAVLPAHLRWRETQPAEFPNPSPGLYSQPVFHPTTVSPVPGISSPSGFMFTTDLDSAPTEYPFAMDVQVALLRTRYYHSKYLVYRPFIYKALHHADQMTHEDAQGVAECLRACLKWPITMSPTCSHKRLIPCLFFWTQNVLGILIILHLSQQVPILSRIRSTLCGERFEFEARETVGLCMDWMRDLKRVDKAAAWAWSIVACIYRLED